jgi:hypothetical protein
MGDWYMSWGVDIRKGLAGVWGTEGIGDMGMPNPDPGSAIRLGMDIKLEFTSKERAPWSQGV